MRRTWLAFFVLVAFGVLRFHQSLFRSSPLSDEVAYEAGFRLLSEGKSPYEHARFLYSPAFAHVGAFAHAVAGASATRIALRLANLAGAVTIAWLSFAFVIDLRRRTVLAAALLAMAPPLVSGVETANLGQLAAALVLLGLTRAIGDGREKDLFAGLLFALSFLVKPLALVATLVVGIRSRRAALLGLVGFAVTFMVDPANTLVFFTRGDAAFRGEASGSLFHVFELLGVPIPSVAITIGVALGAMLLARRADASQLFVIATAASVLALPLVWTHSFAIAVPIIVKAYAIHVRRVRAAGTRDERSRAILGFILVSIGCLVIAVAHVWRGFLELSGPTQAFLVLIPLVTTVLLARETLSSGNKFGHLTAP